MTSTICRGCGRADCPAPTARAAYDAAKAALEAAQAEVARLRAVIDRVTGLRNEWACFDSLRHTVSDLDAALKETP